MSRWRPNHATVVAYLALLVALSGTAYAAATITGADVVDESLTGADVQNKSIGGSDIAGASVGSGKIIDNSLGAIDLAPNSVGTSEVADNSLSGADVDESTLVVPPGAAANVEAAGSTPGSGSPRATGTFFPIHTVDLTTSLPSRLLVTGHVDGIGLSCTGATTCTVEVGLYVDDEPLPNTGKGKTCSNELNCGVSFSFHRVGTSVELPPGTHTIQLKAWVPTDQGSTGVGADAPSITALAIPPSSPGP